ncbi:SDR family NAD(P)-dependent oxidoreductase [Aquibacillus salsiterrae]|uniref:Glucose 1-dehydrogenase n=1 Tax=Aquibacillus salsiterrae TaxID=2950439 RepID=A0A9X4AFN2_9BACI|nr:glucose 1-dehydrogenase [Aquibacillus salsiterrae]MDC3416198.1 glucose 1-dehydrogenase [Aquibacillus salsiterrae]
MNIDLNGKNALVTGAGSGIGKKVAMDLASCGANVVVHYGSNKQGADEAVQMIKSYGVKVLAIQADVLKKDEVESLVQQSADFFGGTIDILVNNAGGLVKRTLIEETEEELWHRIIDLNLTSAFLVTKAVIPFMKKAGGSIVNMTSLAAQNGGGHGAIPYATSKAGLMTFSKGLAKELAPFNIRVNNVSPGLIGETSFHDTFTPNDARKKTVEGLPIQREGVPTDVSGTVVYLASEWSSYITGETIEINGGALMR